MFQPRITLRDSSVGEQGWGSGESTRLPPMWPGFDSRTRRHMWVELVVGSRPCSERFSLGTPKFPLSTKTNVSKFQFDLETVERRATLWIPLKFPFSCPGIALEGVVYSIVVTRRIKISVKHSYNYLYVKIICVSICVHVKSMMTMVIMTSTQKLYVVS